MMHVRLEITLITTFVAISASYAVNVVASPMWGTICYGDLGCFQSFPPGIFPEPPCLIRPKLRLYIPSSDEAVHVYGYDSTVGGEDEETKKSLRDPSKKLIFVSHGFGESGASEWLQAVKNVKTKTEGENVIIVDWSTGSRGSTFYLGAAANSVLVGRVVARLCLQLVKAYEISLDNVEFVGFSLGAQVAGFFAKEMFEKTGAKIGRITALDCAAPQFESRGIYPSKDHVNFIEAVHTSSGRGLLKGRVGISIDYGHVDYYMNGGMHQPGCGFSVFDIACSHQRAHEYYVDAIVNKDKCLYRGFPCASVRDANRRRCQPVLDATHFIGQDNVTTQHAILLVKTNKADPYCIPYPES